MQAVAAVPWNGDCQGCFRLCLHPGIERNQMRSREKALRVAGLVLSLAAMVLVRSVSWPRTSSGSPVADVRGQEIAEALLAQFRREVLDVRDSPVAHLSPPAGEPTATPQLLPSLLREPQLPAQQPLPAAVLNEANSSEPAGERFDGVGEGFRQGDSRLWPGIFAGAHATTNDVVVFCLSRRDAFSVRQTIRSTWAKGHDNVYFVTGASCHVPPDDRLRGGESCARVSATAPEKQEAWEAKREKEDALLDQEQKNYGDLAKMPGVDGYDKLPQKIKFMYEWGLAHTNATWFVKVDDDMVVRVSALQSWIATKSRSGSMDPFKPTIIGGIVNDGSVARSGKWAEKQYAPDKYPKFPIGSNGHIVNKPVATFIAQESARLLDYQGEDTSIGIWLDESPLKFELQWVDALPRNNKNTPQDGIMWAGSAPVNKCRDARILIIGHQFGEEKMRACVSQFGTS